MERTAHLDPGDWRADLVDGHSLTRVSVRARSVVVREVARDGRVTLVWRCRWDAEGEE
jgi:hypothetical protein